MTMVKEVFVFFDSCQRHGPAMPENVCRRPERDAVSFDKTLQKIYKHCVEDQNRFFIKDQYKPKNRVSHDFDSYTFDSFCKVLFWPDWRITFTEILPTTPSLSGGCHMLTKTFQKQPNWTKLGAKGGTDCCTHDAMISTLHFINFCC